MNELEKCCLGLESSKITERKRSYELMVSLLDNEKVIQFLNSDNNSDVSWAFVVNSVNSFIMKEAEKRFLDEPKKKAAASVKKTGHHLLLTAMKHANRGETRLAVRSLVNYVITCFDTPYMKKYYSDTYLIVLKNYILCNEFYLGEITADDWLTLLNLLKLHCQENSNDHMKVLECLLLTLKWGPLHKMPSLQLRQEFSFIDEVCNQMCDSPLKQEVKLKLLIEFCKGNVKDCCMACCKLGEQVFSYLVGLYNMHSLDDFKILFFEFLLLQVQLHHPNGSTEQNVLSYACSWTNWNKVLRSSYAILTKEIDENLGKIKTSLLYNSNGKTMHQTFVSLTVEVCRQVISSGTCDVTQVSLMCRNEEEEPPTKVKRVDVGISAIISKIQGNVDWPWINVVTELLKKYPDLIVPQQFTLLLQTLSALQIETKDADVRSHVYSCLIVLVNVQKHLKEAYLNFDVEPLLGVIWESTLRSVGLNQNNELTHNLLQQLMLEQKTLQFTPLLQMYLSGILTVTKHSMETLNVACRVCNLPEKLETSHQSVAFTRKTLLKWILNIDKDKCETDVFAEAVTAQVLTYLVCKQWPEEDLHAPEAIVTNNLENVGDVYTYNQLERSLTEKPVDQTTSKKIGSKSHLIYKEVLDELVSLLCVYVGQFADAETENPIYLKNLINTVVLLTNVSSGLMYLNELTESNFDDFSLTASLKLILSAIPGLLEHFAKLKGSNVKHMLVFLAQLQKLFSSNVHPYVCSKIKGFVSVDLLKIMFKMLNSGSENEDRRKSYDDLESKRYLSQIRLEVVRTLSAFCLFSKSSEILDVQENVMETLADAEFQPKIDTDYKMMVTFMSSMKHCKPGSIPNSILTSIMMILQRICQERYSEYAVALAAVEILNVLYSHVVKSGNNELRENCITFLIPFYDNRLSYGPKISVAILNCLEEIAKMDDGEWPQEGILTKMPRFLSSHFQEVRLTAVQKLVTTFKNLRNYERQKELFDIIKEESMEVFTIEGVLSEEQKVDETVTRSASVLHTYAALISTSSAWRCHALFALLEIVYLKSLNVDLAQKILDIVAKETKYLDASQLITSHIDFLIEEWYWNNYPLKDFPYILLDCAEASHFFTKYRKSILPLVLEKDDTPAIEYICQHTGKSLQELVEESLPKVIVWKLKCTLAHTSETATSSNISSILNNAALLLERVDDVLVEMISLIFDKEHFSAQFNVDFALQPVKRKSLSVADFTAMLACLEDCLPISSPVLKYCMLKCPNQLQNIILKLRMNVHDTAGIEEKTLGFQQLTLFIDLLVAHLKPGADLNTYFVRNISYMLMHLINDNFQESTVLNILACVYLKKFSAKILASDGQAMDKILIVIVSTIVPIASLDSELSAHCVDLLNFFVVENNLQEAVQVLDPFPNLEKFRHIQEEYNNIKYANKTFKLEDEIKHFMRAGDLMKDVGCRAEGLKHLRNKLATEKEELKELYEQLHRFRGFSEDCAESLIHRLICTLVKLTGSTNSQVSMEATRCLGELGPADLTTLVLQAENKGVGGNFSPFQLITGHIVALLSDYIVDPHIHVVNAAHCALYEVLLTKEGQCAAESKVDRGFGVIQKSHLAPFVAETKPMKNSWVALDENLFENVIDKTTLWCPEYTCSHEVWITDLVCKLLKMFSERSYLAKLVPVCKVKVSFSERLLPLIIYLILTLNNAKCVDIISLQMCGFFDRHWKLSLEKVQKPEVALRKPSVQCMLNVVHFVRLQRNESKSKFATLSLDYLKVAQAAQFCSAHFTAVLYAELWSQDKLRRKVALKDLSLSPLDSICESMEPNLRMTIESIFREAYTQVGDLDALHGCGLTHLLDSQAQVGHYKQLQRWDQVVLHYDIHMSQGEECLPPLLHALKKNALYELPLQTKISSESQYECAWRLGQWNLSETTGSDSSSFESCKYLALKYLHENDAECFNEALVNARHTVIDSLRHVSLESSKNLYQVLAQLQALQEIEDFGAAKEGHEFEFVFKKWQLQDKINPNDFLYIEPIKAQRITMVKDRATLKIDLKDRLVDMLLGFAEFARSENYYNIARRAIADLSFITDLTADVKEQLMFQDAQISWSIDKKMGKYILRHLIDNSPSNERLFSESLKLYGIWMAQTCSENSQKIIGDYFLQSLRKIEKVQKTDNDYEHIYNTYDVMARFADNEYQRFLTYVKSSEFERKVKTMEKSRLTAETIQRSNPTVDEKKAIIIQQRQSNIDQTEIENTYKEKNAYLLLAMKYYLLNLRHSDKNNIRVFRIMSMWLENRNNTELATSMNTNLKHIPSYKFISVLPQLIPHLSNVSDDSLSKEISLIIERCAVDHPHHTLPIIMCIANGNKDEKYSTTRTKTESYEPRVLGTKSLLNALKRQETLIPIIEQIEKMYNALIDLAYISMDDCRSISKDTYEMPRDCKVRKLKNLDDILLPTLSLQIRKDSNYHGIIGVHSFGTSFANVGGLNAPKRITCKGTDGITRTQLVKGKDDLRQDAVMQQVFMIMNELLASNKQTTKLLIRTYKVVPLTKRSGILEWVENTTPLGDYLTGKKGAHESYNIGDISTEKCRSEFKNAAKYSNERKLTVYNDICKRFQPVLHKFFEISFPQPTVWYERRRAYMHSVATSSMCGYILGIGDRHVQNILIDKSTAEVIHIDFGIAFEQGRVLPTPETVPFRLTRDIEAGMGISGIEGVFRRSCEKTLVVLRQNSETILTILEVLLYDPLYAWTITPAQAYSRQFSEESGGTAAPNIVFNEEDNTPVNATAERTLLRLRQKLDGTEGGSTSVEGQVERLLQLARDPANLCRLFYGWQPYL